MTAPPPTMTQKSRARDLGLQFDGRPGPLNAITDVCGVEVGFKTHIEGSDCRTGVTVILPRGRETPCRPTRAAMHCFNGNGEMTGSHWVGEAGHFTGPIGITNTLAVGAVHEGIARWLVANNPAAENEYRWFLPVVAETWDGYLNDIEAFRITPSDIEDAIANASGGAVLEGNVGGGTGMCCYGFKGGSGTSSRLTANGRHTIGAFVQANFGRRGELMMRGVPIGRLTDDGPSQTNGHGSIIVVLATDAPLNAAQLGGLSRRATLGIGRTGTAGHHESGDLFIAFSTVPLSSEASVEDVELSGYFADAVDAVEEAILNALAAAETMVGFHSRTIQALDHDLVRRVCDKFNI